MNKKISGKNRKIYLIGFFGIVFISFLAGMGMFLHLVNLNMNHIGAFELAFFTTALIQGFLMLVITGKRK